MKAKNKDTVVITVLGAASAKAMKVILTMNYHPFKMVRFSNTTYTFTIET